MLCFKNKALFLHAVYKHNEEMQNLYHTYFRFFFYFYFSNKVKRDVVCAR